MSKSWSVDNNGIFRCPVCGYPSRSGPCTHSIFDDEYDGEECSGSPDVSWVQDTLLTITAVALWIMSFAVVACFIIAEFITDRFKTKAQKRQST